MAQGEAVRLFFDAKPAESARVFDRLVVAVPAAEPDLFQAARGKLLPVGEDARVPMKEILELYSGKCEPAAVLAAAEQGAAEARRNQLCYAHLYLGLYFEAMGDAGKARGHILQAAGPFRMDHYMGKVAVMHAQLRNWPVETTGQPQQ